MTQDSNVQLVRRALESGDPQLLSDDVVWHFLSPVPELVAHFEGKDQVTIRWPKLLEELTDGTFAKRPVEVWPAGPDLVVAHLEVDMTINGERRAGATVVVYRVANGIIVEGFDIPSALL